MAEPIRTCIGCRERDRRGVLTRVVACGSALVIDGVKRAPGRGAYLHARVACLDAFARRGGFVRSLRCVIPKAQRAALRAGFPEVFV